LELLFQFLAGLIGTLEESGWSLGKDEKNVAYKIVLTVLYIINTIMFGMMTWRLWK